MVISRAQNFSELALPSTCELPEPRTLFKAALLLLFWLLMIGLVRAQGTGVAATPDESPVEIRGTTDSTVFGMGHSIRIIGNVKQGAMALGGDVIV